MNRLKFEINGQPSKSKPENFDKIQVEVDWKGTKDIEVEVDKLVWRGEDAEQIIAMVTDQYSTFVNRPFQMSVDGYNLPPMMIDLRNGFKQIGCNEVEHTVQMVQKTDWLTARASSLSFKMLEEQGLFNSSHYHQQAYNINYIPDAIQVAMLSLSLFSTTKSTIEFVKETASSIIETITAAIPAVGAGAVITVGQIAQAIVMIIIRVAYFVLLVITLVKLFKALLEQLYSKTRYHTCIYEKALWEVACAKLGLTFVSDLYNDPIAANTVYMPSKTERGKFNKNIKNGGAPNRKDNGFYFFGEFIESMKRKYNGDFRIVNGQLRFERWDWWQNNSSYILPSNYTNQSRMLNEQTTNADEFKGGYFISFAVDQTDRNTLDQWTGTSYDIITNNANSLGTEYDNSGGGLVIDILQARGIRKEDLTPFEKFLKSVLKVVDSAANLLGGNSNLASLIEGRIGNLLLSDHFTELPKHLVVSGNSLVPNQTYYNTGQYLWDNYHYINSFVKINGKHNQWIKKSMELKFCKNDFVLLLNNNFAKTESGQDVEIERLVWTIEEDVATIDFRINERYNLNLVQTFINGSNTSLAGNPEI